MLLNLSTIPLFLKKRTYATLCPNPGKGNYLKKNMVHVEIVVLVAIIAIARKVIIWDSAKQSNNDLIPYAAMLLGLAITYFIIKYSDRNGRLPWKSKENRRPFRAPQQPKQEK